MFYYGDDFVVAVAAVVAVVVYFECVDFVVFPAGAAYALFVDCVPTVVEFVVVAAVVCVCVCVCVFMLFHLMASSGCTTSVIYVRGRINDLLL